MSIRSFCQQMAQITYRNRYRIISASALSWLAGRYVSHLSSKETAFFTAIVSTLFYSRVPSIDEEYSLVNIGKNICIIAVVAKLSKELLKIETPFTKMFLSSLVIVVAVQITLNEIIPRLFGRASGAGPYKTTTASGFFSV